MRKSILGALFGIVVLIGCGSTSPMVGTWELQLSEQATKQMPQGMEKPTVTVEFKADGTFDGKMKMGTQESSGSGTWKLEGKELAMTTTKEDGKAKEPKEEKVTLSDDMKSFELPGAGAMGKMVKK